MSGGGLVPGVLGSPPTLPPGVLSDLEALGFPEAMEAFAIVGVIPGLRGLLGDTHGADGDDSVSNPAPSPPLPPGGSPFAHSRATSPVPGTRLTPTSTPWTTSSATRPATAAVAPSGLPVAVPLSSTDGPITAGAASPPAASSLVAIVLRDAALAVSVPCPTGLASTCKSFDKRQVGVEIRQGVSDVDRGWSQLLPGGALNIRSERHHVGIIPTSTYETTG